MKIQLIRSATLRLEYARRRFVIDPYLAAKHSRPSFTGKSPNPLIDLPCAPQDIIASMDSLDHATVSREALRHYATAHGIQPEQLLIPTDGETLVFL